MKQALMIIASFLTAGVVIGQSPSMPDNFKKLDWLEGTWTRTDEKPGRSGFEQWSKISATEWKGTGTTMKGQDTIFTEKLKLVIKDSNIYYAADVPENKKTVYFKFTEITDHGFVCENPEHDFPKRIAYRKDGNKLKATISGNGKSIDYWFEKKIL